MMLRTRPPAIQVAKKNTEEYDAQDLYLASVQCPEADVAFFEKVFKKHADRPMRYLREDFCGTAASVRGMGQAAPGEPGDRRGLPRADLGLGAPTHPPAAGARTSATASSWSVTTCGTWPIPRPTCSARRTSATGSSPSARK